MKVLMCEDCSVAFQVYAPPGKGNRRFYCPCCGEYHGVQPYHRELSSEKNVKIRWSEKEIELVKQVKDNKLALYQVALMTGRSINSVRKKVSRI